MLTGAVQYLHCPPDDAYLLLSARRTSTRLTFSALLPKPGRQQKNTNDCIYIYIYLCTYAFFNMSHTHTDKLVKRRLAAANCRRSTPHPNRSPCLKGSLHVCQIRQLQPKSRRVSQVYRLYPAHSVNSRETHVGHDHNGNVTPALLKGESIERDISAKEEIDQEQTHVTRVPWMHCRYRAPCSCRHQTMMLMLPAHVCQLQREPGKQHIGDWRAKKRSRTSCCHKKKARMLFEAGNIAFLTDSTWQACQVSTRRCMMALCQSA